MPGPSSSTSQDREGARPHVQGHSLRQRVETLVAARGSRSVRSARPPSAAFATSSEKHGLEVGRARRAPLPPPGPRLRVALGAGPARERLAAAEHDVEGAYLPRLAHPGVRSRSRSLSARPDARRAASETASRFSRTAGARPASSSASSVRPITTVIRLLMTCAQPSASRPISSIFSAERRRSSAASSRRSRRFSAVAPDEAHEEEEREHDESGREREGGPGRSGRQGGEDQESPHTEHGDDRERVEGPEALRKERSVAVRLRVEEERTLPA